MDCALPALFVVIIYFMGGLRLTATAFLSNLTALVSSRPWQQAAAVAAGWRAAAAVGRQSIMELCCRPTACGGMAHVSGHLTAL
jgi:hypothetical protein